MQSENLIATADNCRYCLMCRHVCPVGCVTLLETLTPHGWGMIIASVRRGLLSWNPETVEMLYSCADCGMCQAHCVTDQPLPSAIAAARAEVYVQNLASSKVSEINQALQTWGNPYQPQAPKRVEGKGSVALFVGDEAQYLEPDVLQSALTLLEAIGVEPVLIGVGRNNGYLASSMGLIETAQTLAQATLSELEACGATRLLVLSPGDYYTFTRLYEERLGITRDERIEVSEVVTLISEQTEAGKLRFKQAEDKSTYAYLDPTHAIRVPERHQAPRNLLSAVMTGERRELFWRSERAHPVGNTALQFLRPGIAKQLTYARLEDARQSGAHLLITDDPGTLHTLRTELIQFNAPAYDPKIQGLYELLAGNVIRA